MVSYLRFVPASMANTPIDWSRVPEGSKKFLRKYEWQPLPTTVADLAKMLDETKFFGYFDSGLCTVIMDISEFGLQAAPDQVMRAGPRFYMKYLGEIWVLLFTPGKRDCIVGHSDDIRDEDEELEDEDVRLEQDILRGMARLSSSDDIIMEADEEDEEEMYERRAAEEVVVAQKFDARMF